MAKKRATASKATKVKKVKSKIKSVPGTLIDDSAALTKLAACLKATPDLNVAEAIRKIGISDQASIRRLRGKYSKLPADRRSLKTTARRKAVAAKTATKAKRASTETVAKSGIKSGTISTPMAAVALSTQSRRTRKSEKTFAAKPAAKKVTPRKTKNKAARKAAATSRTAPPIIEASPAANVGGQATGAQQQTAALTSDAMINLTPWMTGPLSLTSSIMHSQIQMYQQAMKLAPVAAMVKQQVEFSKTMMSLFSAMPVSTFGVGTKK